MEIASYLPLSSTASLAFTTRRVYADIYHSPFRKLKTNNIKDYTELLVYLARDRPHLSLCHFCISLHKVDNEPVLSNNTSNSDHGLARVESPSSDISLFDKSGKTHSPSPKSSTKTETETLSNLRTSQIYPFMLRKSGRHGINQQSIYVSHFSADSPRSVVCFISPETQQVFTATYSWAAEARIAQPSPHFTQLIQLKLVLSKPLWSDKDFVNLKQALRAVDMHCCKHCPAGSLDREVACKLSRILFREQNGVCTQHETGYECNEHRHSEGCNCESDIDVEVVGWCSLVVKVWTGVGERDDESVQRYGRGSVKRMFEEYS
jgi:hypothetical protein